MHSSDRSIGFRTQAILAGIVITLMLGAVLAASPVFGASPTQMGVCINARWADQHPDHTQLRALGARWVRTLVYKDNYSKVRDAYYQYAGVAKILVVVNHETFGVNPPPGGSACAGTLWEWNAYAADFAQAVVNFALSYDAYVDAYEIWNEPDIDEFIPRCHFTLILDHTVTALRNAGITKPLIHGAVAGPDWVAYLQHTMAAVGSGIRAELAGVGLHPYGKRADGYPTEYVGELDDAIYTARSVAYNKPVWVTEFGLPKRAGYNWEQEEVRQAEYVRRAYNVFNRLGTSIVPAAFVFAWDDRVHGPYGQISQFYGLVDASHQPIPAHQAYRSVLCPRYTSVSSCDSYAASSACAYYYCANSCRPRGTTNAEACNGGTGFCNLFDTVTQCDMIQSQCAWYFCVESCLQRGTPVDQACGY